MKAFIFALILLAAPPVPFPVGTEVMLRSGSAVYTKQVFITVDAARPESLADAMVSGAIVSEWNGTRATVVAAFQEGFQVEIEGGDHPGVVGMVRAADVRPLVDPDWEREVDALLAYSAARTIEQAKNHGLARRVYGGVMRDFPGTDGARQASRRLKALEPKP